MKRKLLIRMGMFLAGMHALAAGAQQPAISGVSPMLGYTASSVVISGSNFNASPGSNIVFFGATRASVSAASATSLTVSVPAGATYKPVTVNNTASALVGYSQYPFLPTYDNSTYLSGILNFAGKVDFAAVSNCQYVAIGDIDGDGKPDVVLLNGGVATMSVYRNTSSVGTVSYAAGVNFTTNGSPTRVVIGDIDGDGKPDISVSHFGSTASVFRNLSSSGSISLATKVDLATGTQSSGIAIGDIDNDGKTDIAVSNWGSSNVSVLRNTSSPGTITFATKVDIAAGPNPNSITIGDLDGDGKLDMVVANIYTTTARALRNTGSVGSISFAAGISLTTGNEPAHIIIGDMDGDSKADLVIANKVSSTISAFRNTGSSGTISFAAKVDFATGLNPSDVAIGDINGDGKLDIATANGTDNTVSVFRNTGSSGTISFAAKTDFATGSSPTCVAIGDVDGDGKPDMAVSNHDGPSFSILRNNPLPGPTNPTITGVSPLTGNPGSSVVLMGTNFNNTPDNNIVFFGATRATVTAASTTSLTATVPIGATYKEVSLNNTALALTGYSKYSFLPTYDNSAYIPGRVNLAGKVDFTTDPNPRSIAISDIDGDGKSDMVVVNQEYGTVLVYRNISSSGSIASGSFATPVNFLFGTETPRNVAVGDIDGDGKPDMAVTIQEGYVFVFRNTSSIGSITAGSFATRVGFTTGIYSEGVAIGDIDGDGKPDLAVTNIISNAVSLIRNTGSPGSISLASPVTFATGVNPFCVAIGDIDSDGRPDLAVANYGDATVSVLRNTSSSGSISSGSFATHVTFATGSSPSCVLIGDIDGDGKPDLAVTNSNASTVSVYHNTSTSGSITSGSFAAQVPIATGTNPYSVAIGDIDGDGKPDLATANISSGNVSIIRNISSVGSISTGSFAEQQLFATGTSPIYVAIGDLDGDDKPDVVAANFSSSNISVLRNNPLSPIEGTTSVCTGAITTLTNSTSGGTWSSSDAGVASVGSSTGVVTGVSAGTAMMSYTVTGGSATVIVSVNPSPSPIISSAPLMITTVAGSGSGFSSGDGGQATAAGFTTTWNVRLDAAGNMYIIDGNSRIRKVNTAGVITTVAGNGTFTYSGDGGPATAAGFGTIFAIAVDAIGNIFVADGTHRIRKIATSGIVTTIAGNGTPGATGNGGAATAALLSYPKGIAIDISGNIYISEIGTSRIRKINTSGIISTYAGGSGSSTASGVPATATYFSNAGGLSCDAAGNVYIADRGHSRVCKITTSGMSYTIAGISGSYGYSGDGGQATAAMLNGANDVCVGPDGSIYIAEDLNHIIRKVSTSGIISTVAGSGSDTHSGDDGLAANAGMWAMGIDIDASGNLFVATYSNFRIRKIYSGPVCTGSSITLSDATSGGTWSSSNTAKATVDVGTGIVNGIAAGTATITYILATGCYTTTEVSVNALPSVNAGSGIAICNGSSTTLIATGATTYSWSPATALSTTTGASVSANPTVTTTYTVTGTTGSCSNTATTTVTVNALNDAGTITGADEVVVGSAITLTASVSDGAWSASNTNATVSSGVVTGITEGTCMISYIVSGICGSDTATKLVTITTATTPITGELNACAGSTTSLSHGTAGGVWTSSDNAVATVNAGTGLVSGIMAGTATISYTYTGITVSVVVTISASPAAIGGMAGLCPGATTLLTHSSAGGTWSSSNVSVATVSSTGTVSGITSGTAALTYMISAACYRVKIMNVYSMPTPISGPTSICVGSSNEMTSTLYSSTGVWSSAETTSSVIDETTGYLTGIAAGTNTITYTTSEGCYRTLDVTVNSLPEVITGTGGICEGSTTLLSSATPGGTWVSSNVTIATVSSTGLVSGISAGTVSITYTSSDGCRRKKTVTVEVMPSVITGALTVCTGNTTTLSSATTGAIWSSAASGIATVDAGTGLVSGISPGTADISYSNGSCYRTVVVTVNVATAASTGTTLVCAGQAATLSNATSGGTWSSSNTAAATVHAASGLVTGIGAGTTNITYALSGGCNSITEVTVNAAMGSIAGTTSACIGSSTTLSHSAAGGVWSSSNVTRTTIDAGTGLLTGVSGGSATISYVLSAGCVSTVNIMVYGLPNTIGGGSSSFCLGAGTNFSCTPGGGTWSSSNTGVATIGSTGLIASVSAGTSVISYTLGTGCASTRTLTVLASPSAITGSATACIGSTTVLGSTPTGGMWTSSAPSKATVVAATGVVTGVATGNSTISYTLATGCRRTIVATVVALPGAIGGVLTLCSSCSTTLTSATTGGTWSSANTGVATVNSSTGVVSGVGAGTATISYTAASGCARTAIVTVSAAPSSITGFGIVCVGQTNATLAHPVSGGTWSSSNLAIARVHATNGLLTGYAVGNATITYTTSPGVYTIIVATVSAMMSPNVGGTTICPDATTTLTNATSGGNWSSSNILKAVVDAGTGVVTGVTGGTASVSYVVNLGCYRVSTITVNSAPNTTGATTVVNGTSTAFGGSPGGGTWSSANPAIASVSVAGVVTGNSVAATNITYTLGTGCLSIRPINVLTARPNSPMGSGAAQAGVLTVYPNPTSGKLTIDAPVAGMFTVYTIDGKEVTQYNVTASANMVSLPQHLAAGIYMCRFIGTDGSTAIVRLVLEH